MDIKSVLKQAIKDEASDVHMNVGMVPIFRKKHGID